MKPTTFLFLMFFSTGYAIAQDTFLCIPSEATGFRYFPESHRWHSAKFNVTSPDMRKIFTKHDGGWEVRSFGDDYGQDCDVSPDGNFFRCSVFGGEIEFNRDSLRYLESSTGSYVRSNNKKDMQGKGNYSAILIMGECSPL